MRVAPQCPRPAASPRRSIAPSRGQARDVGGTVNQLNPAPFGNRKVGGVHLRQVRRPERRVPQRGVVTMRLRMELLPFSLGFWFLRGRENRTTRLIRHTSAGWHICVPAGLSAGSRRDVRDLPPDGHIGQHAHAEEARRWKRQGRPRHLPPPVGTVTFMLSDVEESTALWESHPVAMGLAIPAITHCSMLPSSCTAADWSSEGGDGVIAAFNSASAALSA